MIGQDTPFEEVSSAALARHRDGHPPSTATADPVLPASVATALTSWAQQLAQDACAPLNDQLSQAQAERAGLDTQLAQLQSDHAQTLARLTERDASIDRLTVELRHARDVASEALVGKAKDQLAIDGKDAQIADLRREIERHIALTAAASDARLAAAMELVGAVTARDNFAAEITALRAQLDTHRTTSSGG